VGLSWDFRGTFVGLSWEIVQLTFNKLRLFLGISWDFRGTFVGLSWDFRGNLIGNLTGNVSEF
jgi:hypothetical protein